jgi:ribonuclease-3
MCACYLQKLDVGTFLLLGRGEKMNDGRGRETIFSDLF